MPSSRTPEPPRPAPAAPAAPGSGPLNPVPSNPASFSPTPFNPDHAHFTELLDRVLVGSGTSHVWSPHSVATAFALLALGSRDGLRLNLTRALLADRPGATGEERGRALTGLLAGLDAAVLPPEAPALADGDDRRPRRKVAALDLVSVNDLYVSEAEPALPGFEAVVRSRPGAGVHTVDFTADPERVRARANAAVAEVTRGLIRQALPPNSVTAQTVVMLVNALWLRMDWVTAFDTHATADRVFHAPAGDREVPTMAKTFQTGHAHTAGWRMVTLPGGHGTALDVLLPEDDTADPRTPAPSTLSALHAALRTDRVRMELPRFRVESSFRLEEKLREIPFLDVFGRPDPELDGITGHPLRVDSIVHRAVLSVNESGVEGAAVTALAVPGSALRPPQPELFRVDRPFVFVLRRHGAVLFTGRVLDPVDPGPGKRSRQGLPTP